MRRRLYLAAYDVREPKRLRRVHHVVMDYASGGQKSAYECWLDKREIRSLMNRLDEEMHSEDSFVLVPITDCNGIVRRGTAVAPLDREWVYLG